MESVQINTVCHQMTSYEIIIRSKYWLASGRHSCSSFDDQQAMT